MVNSNLFSLLWSLVTVDSETSAQSVTQPAHSGKLYRADQEAKVTEAIAPHHRGRISFHGSWWFARCEEEITLLPGETVYVVGRQNLTLIVEPSLWRTQTSSNAVRSYALAP